MRQVVVCDLDNQAGKRGSRETTRDIDLDARVDVVRRAFPRAVWCRSSATGGLHAWTFLDEPHPLRVALHLAQARLVSAAVGAPRVAERLATAPVSGVPGFLELLPQAFEQGGVIRAPLGPGSALLDDRLCPVALSPGAAVERWSELVGERRIGLLAGFRSPLPAAALSGVASRPGPTRGEVPTVVTRAWPSAGDSAPLAVAAHVPSRATGSRC